MDDPRATIRDFVLKRLNITDCGDEVDLFESGYANSLFAVQLVMFVEKSFGIRLTEQDLDMRNFSSIASVARLVGDKRVEVA